MYKTLLLSLISTIFIGCSSNNALKYFKKEPAEARAIQHTKKADIILNNEQKVLFWATYLNNIEKKFEKSNSESFVITVYFVNSQSQDINENNYSLTLNGKKPLNIKLIDKNNANLKPYTLKNPWANHYLVTFEEEKEAYELNIKLQNNKSNWTHLKFEK